MKNEVMTMLAHYFFNEKETEIHYSGVSKGVEYFIDMLNNGERFPGDVPDMVITKDGKALIIEHFEFDSFRVTKKGSVNRMEQARIDRAQNQLDATLEGVLFKDRIEGKSSYKDYIHNVSQNFSGHYQRIPTYKENLINKGIVKPDMELKTMFLIDDVSPIGSMADSDDPEYLGIVPVILAKSPEFLHLISDKTDVDYILCCSSAGSNEYVWFIDCAQVEAYKKEAWDYSKMYFLASNPKVIGANFLIPHNQEEE